MSAQYKRKPKLFVAVIRIISWVIEILIAVLFLYAFVTLTDMIDAFNIRLAVRIFAFPVIVSLWSGICIFILLVRERILNWYL